jgi:hemin uptake protein HemP
MHQVPPPDSRSAQDATAPAETPAAAPVRIKSQDLFRHGREVEIDHAGRIYRLRLTQLNKLILTA